MNDELNKWIETLESGERFNLGALRVTPKHDGNFRLDMAFQWEEVSRVVLPEDMVKSVLCYELGWVLDWSEGSLMNRSFWTENKPDADRFMDYARVLCADFDVVVTTVPSIKGRGLTAQKFTFSNIRGGYLWQPLLDKLKGKSHAQAD